MRCYLPSYVRIQNSVWLCFSVRCDLCFRGRGTQHNSRALSCTFFLVPVHFCFLQNKTNVSITQNKLFPNIKVQSTINEKTKDISASLHLFCSNIQNNHCSIKLLFHVTVHLHAEHVLGNSLENSQTGKNSIEQRSGLELHSGRTKVTGIFLHQHDRS